MGEHHTTILCSCLLQHPLLCCILVSCLVGDTSTLR